MTFINIVGDRGTGKTLLMTYFASKEKRKPIFSNYLLKLENYFELTPEILITIDYPSLVLLDEGWSWIESRTSGNPINRYMGYIIFQSRKRKIDFILTEQIFETIDVRFRLQCDIQIYAENHDKGFLYEVHKLSGYKNYKPKKFLLTFEQAEKIYPLYDTEELKNPREIEELIYKVSSKKEQTNIEINKIVDKIFNDQTLIPSKITKAIIKAICLKNNYPKFYEDLIYGEIKYRVMQQTTKDM